MATNIKKHWLPFAFVDAKTALFSCIVNHKKMHSVHKTEAYSEVNFVCLKMNKKLAGAEPLNEEGSPPHRKAQK